MASRQTLIILIILKTQLSSLHLQLTRAAPCTGPDMDTKRSLMLRSIPHIHKPE